MGLYIVYCNVYVVVIEDVLDLRQLGLVIINHITPNPVGSVKGNELVFSDDPEVVSTTLKRTVKIRVRDCIGMDNGTIVQDNFRGLELLMARGNGRRQQICGKVRGSRRPRLK